MPTKGNVWRIASTIPYDIIQKGCIKENYERAKKRKISQAVQRRPPVPVRFEFRLVPLLLWRVLERRGVAEPLVYSSTRHSTNC